MIPAYFTWGVFAWTLLALFFMGVSEGGRVADAFGYLPSEPPGAWMFEDPATEKQIGCLEMMEVRREITSEAFRVASLQVLERLGRPCVSWDALSKGDASLVIGFWSDATESQKRAAEQVAFGIVGGQGELF